MLELFVTVCAIHAADHCKDVPFNSYDSSVLPMQLMATAQQEIAKWMDEHPGWRVNRYGTRRAGLYGKA